MSEAEVMDNTPPMTINTRGLEANVYSSSLALYYVDGHYYNSQGEYVPPELAALGPEDETADRRFAEWQDAEEEREKEARRQREIELQAKIDRDRQERERAERERKAEIDEKVDARVRESLLRMGLDPGAPDAVAMRQAAKDAESANEDALESADDSTVGVEDDSMVGVEDEVPSQEEAVQNMTELERTAMRMHSAETREQGKEILSDLRPMLVPRFMKDLGLDPVTGAGSTPKNIEIILDASGLK